MACANHEGICLLEFTDRKDLDKQIENLKSNLKSEIVPGKNDHLQQIDKQLDGYFKGERKKFQLSLVLTGTTFQNKVWNALQEISFGETITYLKLSKNLGNPKAIRAVAGANGANKMAIIIPCHRVIGSDGSMTGYAGGIWRKQWLLEHESKQIAINF